MTETPPRIVVQKKDLIPSTPTFSGRRTLSSTGSAASALKASSTAHLAGLDVRAPIVIEFGSRWTKYGLGGEYTPRKIISSFVMNPATKAYVHVLDRKLSDDEAYKVLNVFLKNIIVKDLLNPASERRLVIVESLFTPIETRQLIAKVLFEEHTFKIPSIIYVPAPLANVFPYGTKTAFVIDIGYNSTTVFPVFEHQIIFYAYGENGTGGCTMTDQIKNYVLAKGKIRDHGGAVRSLNDKEKDEFDRRKVAEDLNARFFMVTRMERAKIIHEMETDEELESNFKFAPDVEVPFGTRKLIIPGYIREAAAECFFLKEDVNGSIPIPDLIMRSLKLSPMDVRRVLLNNILVTGSAAGLPGMLGRLQREIKEQIKEVFPKMVDEVKMLRLPENNSIERYSSWLGGSFFADMDELIHRVYTKDDWANKKPLPDWTRFLEKN